MYHDVSQLKRLHGAHTVSVGFEKTFISTLRLYNHHYQIYHNRLHTVIIIFLSIVYIYKRITLHIDGILANDTSEIHLQWMCSDFKGTDNGRRWITTFRLV